MYNKDTGAKEALSYRCADIDRMVPSLMGVSKASIRAAVRAHTCLPVAGCIMAF